jgi:ketosteroid isomerase-like protein
MSAGSVEVVRRWLESSPDEVSTVVTELFHPDVDYYPVRKFPDAAPCHGRDEFARFVALFRETWSYELTIQELIPVGDDRVLACGTLHAEGRASRIGLAGELYPCFWLRDGRIVRYEDHVTLRGALGALGLDGETLEAAGLR